MLEKRKKWKNLISILIIAAALIFVGFAPLADTASANGLEESVAGAESDARTAQYSIFNVPVNTSSLVLDYQYKRSNTWNRLCISYTTLPSPKSEKEFAGLSSVAGNCLGISYVPAGRSPEEGFDCSGFVLYVLRSCGSKLLAADCRGQYDSCYIMPEGYEAPGDIVFFKGTDKNPDVISHVGLYLGADKMIHAGTGGICIVDLNESYWTEHFFCFGRPLE